MLPCFRLHRVLGLTVQTKRTIISQILCKRLLVTSSKYATINTNSRSKMCKLLQSHSNNNKTLSCALSQSQRRSFWGLDAAFNKVDEERVRLAGPNRACAEWVLRNGGKIRWTTSGDYLDDYNLLPSHDFAYYKLEEIDLSGTDVVSLGFLHFEHLEHVRKVRLHGCRRIDDVTLVNLKLIKETLQELEISWCPMITVKGLEELVHFEKLKHVLIYGLIEVKDLQSTVNDLRQKMPWCKFSTEEPKRTEEEEEKD